jgi:uncharacterized protein
VGIAALEPPSWDGKFAIILGHGAGQGMESPFMSYFHKEPKLQAKYRAVVEEVISKYAPKKVVIGGKSMGGRVASYIAGDTPGVSGLVFLGYPLHPPGKTEQLRDQHLYQLTPPMLFVSGTRDTFAERDLLDRVVRKIGPSATLLWIDGGDHSLKRARKDGDSLRVALDAIMNWLDAGLRP